MKILLASFNFIYSINTVLLLLIIILIILGVYFYYRRTLPDLNKRDKLLLGFTRLIVLLAIIFSIGELAFETITRKSENPVTLILVDNSKSVEFEGDLIKEKLDKLLMQLENSNQKIEIIAFNDKTKSIHLDLLNLIDFSGHSTNISYALNEIIKSKSEKNYQNVVLITDGIYNAGENPIYLTEKAEIPFFIFGVGDPEPKVDVSLDNIIANDLIYAQNKTTIRVNIKSVGFDYQTTTISFYEDNKLIEKRNIQLAGNYQELEFNYTPETEGEKKLSFSIAPLKNEYTEKNNFASKYVKVLSNKIRVLTIAGKPSYDLSFINQAIKSNKDFRLETLIEKNDGTFYPLFKNESFVDSADVIFLIGFPATNNSDRFIRRVLSKIEKDNTPIFILINPDTDFNRLNLFRQYLPFDWRSAFGTASQVLIDVPEEKQKRNFEHRSVKSNTSLEFFSSNLSC